MNEKNYLLQHFTIAGFRDSLKALLVQPNWAENPKPITNLSMDIKPEYIEFSISDEGKFTDMRKVYELIAQANNNDEPQPDEYWLTVFPEYSLKQFYFSNRDAKPAFPTAQKSDNSWSFSGLINLLQTDLDVEFLECKRVNNIGRIEFSACGYPYGGVTGLTIFLNSFGCKATKIDEGGGVYSVLWISENDFELTEIV